jgi:carbon-monoxide dehydrogenase medium subunit
MWHDYFSVTSVDEALKILAERGPRARIVAGATDLILELERGVRKGIDTLVDITRIPDLDQIVMDEDEGESDVRRTSTTLIHLGAMVTHNCCADSKLIVESAFPLAQAAWEVGAPQIRNRGTVAGNLITASPANDTITPLMALDAKVRLASVKGERLVPLSEFYTGVRRTVMQPDEMLLEIVFPALRDDQPGAFIKLGLRRAQAIAVVNAAVILTLEGRRVKSASITLGAVAPTIIHARQAELALAGRELGEDVIAEAAALAMEAATPIDDVRSSADYRSEMVRVCVGRCLRSLAKGQQRDQFPAHPVLLDNQSRGPSEYHLRNLRHHNGDGHKLSGSFQHVPGSPIVTSINGRQYTFTSGQNKTLLRLLREEAGLTGTKEGCAEGECGACTVFLDGMAVMSCLVPAVRAHQAEIVTVEGLAVDGHLHPVQQAFIDLGAVQCGYCTPGLLMSAAKLLEERPNPTHDEIQQAITGNLCRCTGYYKIVEAIERASQ